MSSRTSSGECERDGVCTWTQENEDVSKNQSARAHAMSLLAWPQSLALIPGPAPWPQSLALIPDPTPWPHALASSPLAPRPGPTPCLYFPCVPAPAPATGTLLLTRVCAFHCCGVGQGPLSHQRARKNSKRSTCRRCGLAPLAFLLVPPLR